MGFKNAPNGPGAAQAETGPTFGGTGFSVSPHAPRPAKPIKLMPLPSRDPHLEALLFQADLNAPMHGLHQTTLNRLILSQVGDDAYSQFRDAWIVAERTVQGEINVR